MSIRSVAGEGAYRTSEKYMLIAHHREFDDPGTFPAALYSTGYTGNPHRVMQYGVMDRDAPSAIVPTHSVLSIDSGGTATFGNDTAITAIGQAATWSAAEGRPGPFLLVGLSMGFNDLAAWARVNQSSVSGMIGFVPGVNLSDAHANNSGGLTAAINAAYGGSYSSVTHGPTHDPTLFADELNFPILILSSSNDTLATLAHHQAFAAAAPNCTVVNLGAVGDHNQAAVTAAANHATLQSFIASL